MSSVLPPVLLELRSSASEFISENRAAQESLGSLGVAGDAASAQLQAASAREAAAMQRLATATAVSTDEIRTQIDAQVRAEQKLATEMGAAYDAEARKAQLTATEIKRASSEQIAAQRAVIDATKEVATAEADLAAATATASTKRESAWMAYGRRVQQVAGVAGAAVAFESIKMAADFQKSITLLHTAGGELQSNMGLVASGIKTIATDTGTSLEQLSEGMYTVEKSGNRGAAGLEILRAAAEGAKAENVDLGVATNALTSVMMSYHLSAKQATQAENMLVAGAGAAKETMQNYAGALSTVLPVASAANISFQQVAGAIATLTQHGTSAHEATQELASTIRSLQAPNQVAQKAMQQLGLDVNDVSTKMGQRGLTGTIDLIYHAIADKLGPAGTVAVSTWKKSAAAQRDMQIMLDKMPPQLKAVSEQLLHGQISVNGYNKTLSDMPGTVSILGTQFRTLFRASDGFNQLLRSGQPAAQTFAAYLKQIMGGATGMNTALMLSGENTAYFNKATEDVGKAGQKTGKDISTWRDTQKTLSVQLDRTKQMIEVIAVDIGSKLIPVVSSVVGWFLKHKTATMLLAGVIGGAMVVALGAYVSKLVWSSTATVGRIATMVAAWMGYGPAVELQATAAAAATEEMGTSAEAAAAATDAAFGPVGLAIAAIGVAAVLLAGHWRQVWGGIKTVAESVWNGALRPTFDALKTAWNAVWGVVKAVYDDVIAPVFDYIKAHWGALAIFITGGLSELAVHWRGIWTGIKAVYNTVIAPVFDFIRNHWKILFVALTGGLGLLLEHWHAVWGGIRDVTSAVWSALQPIVHAIVVVGIDPLKKAVQLFGQLWGITWDGIKTVIQDVWTVIKPILDAIKRAIDDTVGAVGKVVHGVSGVVHGAGSVIGKVGHFLGFADGGTVPNGWFTVGEQGPELGYKSGSSLNIFSNSDSNAMMGGAGGGTQVIEHTTNVYIGGRLIQKTVEREQLKAGLRRGTTYQPFRKGS